MRLLFLILVFSLQLSLCLSQDIPPETEQQLENLTDAEQVETEDDSFLQALDIYKRNPLNLNTAEEAELKELRLLSGLQISNLLIYRRLLGDFISIYELQAVPSWDIATIRKIFPFVTVGSKVLLVNEIKERFRGGDHSLLLRASQILEKSKGFDNSTTGTKYLGSRQRLFFRYRYTYKNLLQYGLVGDKDAGEHFFKGPQRGFDFYSFHFFARKIGIIQSFAIGDFTVNMGQGLIQWQSLAFKKSVDVLGIKRQSPVLRPYNSAGEFYFHRGVGITVKMRKWETTLFASMRRLSANFVADTVNNEDFISSFQNSGYHRTPSEIADRNNLKQTSFGGNIVHRGNRWHIGLNSVYYHFSLPVQKRNEPYNLYAISGNSWYNISVDYSYTYKNLHFFGEAAADKNFSKAFVNGLLVSVDPKVDLSFVHRNIAASYQAVYGNAFTENTYPTNETGFYTGISIRPFSSVRIDAYADVFKFPWLKYLVDAPSKGTDFLAQITYTPSKQADLYIRFRNETKQSNQPDNNSVTNFLVNTPRQSLRFQSMYKVSPAFTFRNRAELIWYDKKGQNRSDGFLIYGDFIFKPQLKPFSAVIRLQYFETDDYNSRIYAYENDVLYSYSIPSFFEKGYRYYATLNFDLNKRITVWLRASQTLYPNKNLVGSGLDEIKGNKKTEIKLQIRCIL